MKKVVLSIAMAVLVAACGSQEVKKDVPVADRTTPPSQPTQPTTGQTTPTTQPAITANPLTDPQNILSKRSVYFDFDSDAIKAEFVPLVEAHGAFLRQNPRAKMLVQGNADDRGSREYNLGLGQRRADALKKRLVLLGAQESQIESVSLGEEKPVCTDQTEECWAKNRRDDMLYGGQF